MKLALGTVQFGVPYGAFNEGGQVTRNDVAGMLELAKSANITTLDTARAYGEAEAVLAQVEAPKRFNIVSKCPDLSLEEDPVAALRSAFEVTCNTLGVSHIYGYLLHNARDLERPGVWETLQSLRESNRVLKIGISGYDPDEVLSLYGRYALTLVQLPANVLDPWYERVAFPDTVEVHVRSAFLQGFLLSSPNSLPDHLIPWRSTLQQFRAEAAQNDLTPLQAALAPLLACPKIAKVVVGADNSSQLGDILKATKALDQKPTPRFGDFSGVTKDLTDPRRW